MMTDGTPELPWTYEISRPQGRVWIQSTERFASPEEAAVGLGIYLALTPEDAGSFQGRVIRAKIIPEHPRGYIVLHDHKFEA